MCTVTWTRDEDGCQLLCNRDEKRTRSVARSPSLAESRGVRFVAPRDGDQSGSWIAANEYGVCVCLLNGEAPARPAATAQSRGHVLLHIAAARALDEVFEKLWRMDLSPFAPFTAVALEPGLPAGVVEWDGSEKAVIPCGDPLLPLVSSSYDSAGVRRERTRQFQRLVPRPDPDRLFQFHSSHFGGPSAYSPCMHRPDAETVSFSWVRVSKRRVEFFYSPAAPCRWLPGENVALPRVD
jgi:hypothetical protein